jgi:hypothetical protein
VSVRSAIEPSPALVALPWRGPGPGRPDLPLPPAAMPVLRGGRLRKRWRYLALYSPRLMVCAAAAQIGPLRQSFWQLWDGERDDLYGGTRSLPGGGEVSVEGPLLRIESAGLQARLRFGGGLPVEAVCPSGEGGYAWTRKRAGIPVTGTIETPKWRMDVDALGVDDESAGYHQRHTSWHWSAGVGRASDGRAVAWNLVAGINDPERDSERAIWVEGQPHEPGPARFDGLDAVEVGGSRLRFEPRCERASDDNLLIFRSRYRHRFGVFAGSLADLELAEAAGVMEQHEAVW